MSDANEGGEAFLKLIGILGVTTGLSVLRAATIAAFWRWYVVPVFHLPVLGLWTAFGCCLLVGMFTVPGLNEKKEMVSWGTIIGRSLVWIGMAWALAGILNLLK